MQKPAALELCNELGLGDRLFPTKLPRTAFVLRAGELHPLPAASILGFPTRLGPLVKSTLFRTPAKVRMAAEVIDSERATGRRRIDCGIRATALRGEAVRYVAEPPLAGIHAGDVERLSMRSPFPKLVEAEAPTAASSRHSGGSSRAADPDGASARSPGGLASSSTGC